MITRLHLTSFQSWDRISVDLSPITVIIGETDAGKSALLRGLSCALFNTMEGTGMVRAGQTSAEVSLETDDGHVVTWSRGTGLNRYQLDGQVYDKPGRTVPEPIRHALQIHELEFDGETVRLQWAPQMDAPFLLADSGAKATRMLGVAGNAAITAQAARLAQQEVKKEQDGHRAATIQLERLQAQLAGFADVAVAAPIAEALQEAITSLEALQRRRTQLLAIEREQAAAVARQTVLRSQEHRLLDLTKALDQRVAIAQRWEFLQRGFGAYQGRAQLQALVEANTHIVEALRMQVRLCEIVEVCRQVGALLVRRDALRTTLAEVQHHYESAASQHRTLMATLTCPTCGQIKEAA